VTATAKTPPAPRLKSRWFRAGADKSAGQQASAMAFIVWRVARHALDRMRQAGFDVEVGPPYFAFLREVLVFLVALADRIAHARLDSERRAEFTSALVHHLARILQDNEDDLLGPAPPGGPSNAESFVDLVNEVTGHYAEFGADPALPADDAGFHPDFAFLRYFGRRIEPTLPEKDRRWVLDQVMAVEAPEAVGMVQRSMRDLFDPGTRRARRSTVSGD
jgi:hypothetical protein